MIKQTFGMEIDVRKKRQLLIIAFSFCSAPSFGQANKEILDLSLEELLEVKVVTATKRESTAIKIPALVTVLTEKELTMAGAKNLADGLRFASGITIRKSPGGLPQYTASIRGNDSDFMNMRTLFLIDGVPVRNINAGFDPGWIPLSMVKRVEIVKGPSSNLWGANAFGGVINVITKTGADQKDHLGSVSGGLQSRYDHVEKENVQGMNLAATVGQDKERLDYFASAQYVRDYDSDNFTGQLYQDAFARANYQFSDKVELSLRGLISRDRNQIAEAPASGPIKNNFTHVAATLEIKTDATSTLRFTPYVNTFSHDLSYNNELSHYENHSLSTGLNSQYTTVINDNHAIVAGLDIVQERGYLDTNSFNYSTFPPTLDKVGWGNRHQTTWGTYIQYEYLGWEKFHPTAGVRYDANSLYGHAVSPRLGLSYLIDRNLSLFTSVGRGFRAPVFNETQINGYGKLGTRNLNPEIITTYEIGLKSVRTKTQNAMSFFLQDIADKISLEFVNPSDPNSLEVYRNKGRSKMLGFEFEGSYNFSPGFRAFYNSMLLNPEGSQQIERVVETKFVLGLDLAWNTWTLMLAGIHEGTQFYYNSNDAIADDGQNRVFIPKQTTGNVELSKKLSALCTARLYVNNFTNLKYRQTFSSFEEQNGAILPGREVGLKLESKF